MLAAKTIGRSSGVLKYDILSALSVFALNGDKHRQRTVLRLQALITTRYNWGRNELSIGRREIAKLWAVEERTVKREMSRLRTSGWLSVKHPAARGRVAVYALDLECILEASRVYWPSMGPDFVLRMEHLLDPAPIPDESNVVPFQTPPRNTDVWGQVAQILQQRDTKRYTAWFQHLSQDHIDDGTLILRAPSRFLAQYVESHFGAELEKLLCGVDPDLSGVRILSGVN